MNAPTNNPTSAFDAVRQMESQIHDAVTVVTRAVQKVREAAPPAAPIEPSQVLRGEPQGFIADLRGYVAKTVHSTTNRTAAALLNIKDGGQVLRSQLADVDVEIKQLLQEIDAKRAQEEDAKDATADNQEGADKITEDLDKAADAYRNLLDATSIFD